MAGPRDFTFTLGAGGTQHIRARGRWIGIYDAPAGSLQLTIDGGQQQTRGQGGSVWVERGFREIDIVSAFAQTIRVVVSDQAQAIPAGGGGGGSGSGSGPFNTLPTGADVSCAAGVATLLSAADSTRRALAVCNQTGNAREIRVGGAGVGAASGLRVEPGDTLVLETTAAVYAYNPHGSAMTVNVLPMQHV